MDRLEKFIQQNREDFDDQVPSASVWERIANETNGEKKVKIIPLWSKAAAISIVVVGLGIGMRILWSPGVTPQQSDGFSSEAYEATAYYESQIRQKQEQVFRLMKGQPEVKEQITVDMAMLDSAMIEIKKDLKDNVSNREVIEAMIQNYRLKLQILEDVLSYVDQGKQNETIRTHEL